MVFAGSPVNSEFAKSRCESASDLMNRCVVSLSKYLLMLQILRIFRIAALHLVLMCSLKLSCQSRYLTVEHLSIVSLMTLIVFSLHFESCCSLPKYINSVLDSFSFSLRVSIHALTSSSEGLRIAMVSYS